VSECIEHVKSGKLRALAVTPAKRLDVFPDLPTVGDIVPGYEASGFAGIGAPRGTPAEIIEVLNKELNAGVADPKIKARITELGGTPNLNPEGLATRSHAQYGDGVKLEDMIKEDLIAERIAIATYSEIVRWLGNDDPTTRRMMEELLAKEEEHADDMAKLLARVGK
jgi:bacterioferritin (cytochrome b1)